LLGTEYAVEHSGRWLAGRVSPNTDVRCKGRRSCEAFPSGSKKRSSSSISDMDSTLNTSAVSSHERLDMQYDVLLRCLCSDV
jgi:hypothetical protein